jgi:tellurite resistance protein
MDIKELVNRVTRDGKVTADEHKMILHAVSEDGKLDENEAKEVHRLMQMINEGKLKVE